MNGKSEAKDTTYNISRFVLFICRMRKQKPQINGALTSNNHNCYAEIVYTDYDSVN